MKTLNYRLKGLNCPNCAAGIEEGIRELNGVKEAKVILTSQRLEIIPGDSLNQENIFEDIKNIVNTYEPDVQVLENDFGIVPVAQEIKIPWYGNGKLIIAASALLYLFGQFSPLPAAMRPAFFVLSYLIAGGRVLLTAARNLSKARFFDESFLMAVATIGAFAVKQYPEAAAVMLFFRVGQYFEGLAVDNSRRSIQALLEIKPSFANLITSDGMVQVNPSEITIGDTILVKPGEKVPLDGIVLEGTSFADTSALTGESVPKTVIAGDEVFSGFINQSGILKIKVTHRYDQSAIMKILDMVENAASLKSPSESFITKFAKYYTPAVVAAALLVGTLPPLLTGTMDFHRWIYSALVFLVISCPCALVISIPLSFFGGIGCASRHGILVKGSNHLEALNYTENIIFDKTGTLTKGVFKVLDISAANDFSREQVLEYAAIAEASSNHPIAKSILEAYGKRMEDMRYDSFEEIPGCGIRVVSSGMEILAGNEKMLGPVILNDRNPPISAGGTIVHVAVNQTYAGSIVISDEVKPDAASAIQRLRRLGIRRIILLTGDNETSASYTAEKLGISEFYAGLLPSQKVEKLQTVKMQSGNTKSVFVGDGINDAPVLTVADVGISMGNLGSDAAVEASDIVLITDEPSKVADAIAIAKRTKRIVWQNILFALGVKLVVLVLGALGSATMWEAVFADVGVTLLAVLNSLRVLRYKSE